MMRVQRKGLREMEWRAKSKIGVLLALLALFLCACGMPAKISETDSKALTEMGNALIDDLNRSILRHRGDPEDLQDLGCVVYTGEKTLGSNALAKFYMEYEGKTDTQATLIFADKSFVVTRIIFKGGKGFYLRCSYDENKPEELPVSGKMIDSVVLQYAETPPKWEMLLLYGKEQVADITLKNPQD